MGRGNGRDILLKKNYRPRKSIALPYPLDVDNIRYCIEDFADYYQDNEDPAIADVVEQIKGLRPSDYEALKNPDDWAQKKFEFLICPEVQDFDENIIGHNIRPLFIYDSDGSYEEGIDEDWMGHKVSDGVVFLGGREYDQNFINLIRQLAIERDGYLVISGDLLRGTAIRGDGRWNAAVFESMISILTKDGYLLVSGDKLRLTQKFKKVFAFLPPKW